jgi:hypothetical protein
LGPAPQLLTLHPSHVAENSIGDEGCIALSSSLVHLSHLEVLNLGGKCLIPAVLFVTLLLGAEFDLFYPVGNGSSASVSFDFGFWFLVLVGAGATYSSLSIPHTFQSMTSALKVALRFRHLWFICLIWTFCCSTVSVF